MRQGVEYSFRPALEECSPRLPILSEKIIRMKLKENIIIRCNSMNKSKVFGGLWYMKGMFEF
jgi:hypothetical protein